MTLEKLSKALMLNDHIEALTSFKDELSENLSIKTGCVEIRINEEDIEALKKTLTERITKLEKEFEAL